MSWDGWVGCLHCIAFLTVSATVLVFSKRLHCTSCSAISGCEFNVHVGVKDN